MHRSKVLTGAREGGGAALARVGEQVIDPRSLNYKKGSEAAIALKRRGSARGIWCESWY